MQVEIATNPHVVAPIDATFIANYSKNPTLARRFHATVKRNFQDFCLATIPQGAASF
jgi:hypothetical protein